MGQNELQVIPEQKPNNQEIFSWRNPIQEVSKEVNQEQF